MNPPSYTEHATQDEANAAGSQESRSRESHLPGEAPSVSPSFPPDSSPSPSLPPPSFPPAPPQRAISYRPLSTALVAARFPKAARGETAIAAFALWLLFYGGFAAYVGGLVPGWLFATCGTFVFIRYFDLTHEEIHTRHDGSGLWHALRWVFSVSGPVQLGYTQLAQNHRRHHAHDGTPEDPDAWIIGASPLHAVFLCLTQPEQAVFRWVRANGFDRRLAIDLGVNLAAWLTLAHVCTWPQFLLYNAVVRFGNGASWFVFTFVLHRATL